MEDQILILKQPYEREKTVFNLEPVYYLSKPKKALWTSSYDEEIISDWYEWAAYNNFYKTKVFIYLVRPKENVKVFDLFNSESVPCTYEEINRVWYEYINFERLKKLGYDGVHMSRDALRLVNTNISIYDRSCLFYALHSWDVESIVWLNDDWIEWIKLI